jgi:hypothetical protein
MNYSDTNWTQRSRYNDQLRPSSNRTSLYSTTSVSEDRPANTHLNKTLSNLIDRFDTIADDATPQQVQRHKDRLLERFNHILLT